MPIYEFECEQCQHQWEDSFFSYKDPMPTICPECNVDGQVKKLISLPANGVVELTGRELKAKVKAEGQALKRKAMTDELILSNLVGETQYEANTSQFEKVAKDISKD